MSVPSALQPWRARERARERERETLDCSTRSFALQPPPRPVDGGSRCLRCFPPRFLVMFEQVLVAYLLWFFCGTRGAGGVVGKEGRRQVACRT